MNHTNQEIQENKMGVMQENKLLLSMGVPMALSMLIQAMYNIVDSIFVARLSEDALAAVSLAFPIQQVMISIAAGTGVGVNALLSRRLGQKNMIEANKIANVSILLAGFSYLIFLIFGMFLSRWYFEVQTGDLEIISFGESYLRICCIMSFGIFWYICFERLLQSTGRTVHTMIMQMTGALINIILDPILIFGYFNVPKMGIAGAALATVIGQIVGMIIGFVFNVKYNKDIKLSMKEIRFKWKVIKEIYMIAVPSILMMSIGSVMVFFVNKILLGFTSTAAAVFGVYFKLQSIIFMPVFGISNAMVPIVAYNFGAGNRQRILNTVKYSMFYAVILMLIGLSLAEAIPEQLLSLFDASENMLDIGSTALRIICTCYLFAGINIMATSLFQALGKSVYSLILSIIRQLVVLLPVAYFMSLTGNLVAVWTAFPIAEIAATIISCFFLKRTHKRLDSLTESAS